MNDQVFGMCQLTTSKGDERLIIASSNGTMLITESGLAQHQKAIIGATANQPLNVIKKIQFDEIRDILKVQLMKQAPSEATLKEQKIMVQARNGLFFVKLAENRNVKSYQETLEK